MANTFEQCIRLLVHFDGASPADWFDTAAGKGPLPLQVYTPHPGLSVGSSPKFGTGCYSYSGSPSNAQGIVIPQGYLPIPRTMPYTVAAWVFMTANQPSFRSVVWIDGDSDVRMSLIVLADGRVEHRIGPSLGLISSMALPLNQWNLIEASRDHGGTTRLFVNGVIGAESTTVFDVVGINGFNRSAGMIGCRPNDSGTTFMGKIDEVVYATGTPWHTTDYSANLPASAFADPVPSAPRATESRVTRLNAAWPTNPLGVRAMFSSLARYDAVDGGPLKIAGTVSIKNVPSNLPVARRVRLFEQLTGRLVRETWSDANGAYSFTKIKNNKYFVVSHDHTLNDNAAIKDQITPEVPT